jgi:ankyrin repeat protein
MEYNHVYKHRRGPMSLPRNLSELTQEELSNTLFECFQEKKVAEIKAILNSPAKIAPIIQSQARNKDNNTLQHLAAYLGDLDIIRLLKKRGMLSTEGMLPLNNAQETPLHIAASQGNDDIVTFLSVDPRSDEPTTKLNALNRKGLTSLHEAVNNNRISTVIRLIEARADIALLTQDNRRESPLHMAARKGHSEIVQNLLKAGANIAARSIWMGNTPLQLAAENGHLDTVKLLIEVDQTKIDSQNTGQGRTPLHLASQHNHLSIVNYLIEAGANIEATDSKKSTPLHLAAESGSVDALNYLISQGAAINALNANGENPLHLAIKATKEEATLTLLAFGAQVLTPWGSLPNLPVTLEVARQNRPQLMAAIEKAAEKEQNIKIEKAHTELKNQLHQDIDELVTYKNSLPKGRKSEAVKNLETTLREEVDTYFKKNDTSPETFEMFKGKMLEHLNPTSPTIKQITAYRLNLKTVFKSIFLTLSIFGLVVGKLTHAKPGSPLFFGPNHVRGREQIQRLRNKINEDPRGSAAHLKPNKYR